LTRCSAHGATPRSGGCLMLLLAECGVGIDALDRAGKV
jgi:hypothetical protein